LELSGSAQSEHASLQSMLVPSDARAAPANVPTRRTAITASPPARAFFMLPSLSFLFRGSPFLSPLEAFSRRPSYTQVARTSTESRRHPRSLRCYGR